MQLCDVAEWLAPAGRSRVQHCLCGFPLGATVSPVTQTTCVQVRSGQVRTGDTLAQD